MSIHSQIYNIGLVMHLLNHSSEAMTLNYLGLDQASRETMLDQIDFANKEAINGHSLDDGIAGLATVIFLKHGTYMLAKIHI
ncbi:hypothetical protein BI355_2281 (plasmid) [Companilactobacillus crustorum]|nr:hypothetical protein BI355_2281 [Companilactobacillus crustorum]